MEGIYDRHGKMADDPPWVWPESNTRETDTAIIEVDPRWKASPGRSVPASDVTSAAIESKLSVMCCVLLTA